MIYYKFRGIIKDSKTNEFMYGSFVIDTGKNYKILSPLKDQINKGFWENKFRFSDVIKSTVGQFTGLTDNNGKEIYEGDIVLCKEYENIGFYELNGNERHLFELQELKGSKRAEYISEVFYDEANFYLIQDNKCEVPLCCFFGDRRNSSIIYEIEVIGDKHHNSELLNKKQIIYIMSSR